MGMLFIQDNKMFNTKFLEAYLLLSNDDKILINSDAHNYGQAFIDVDVDGNVKRVDPKEVFTNH